MSLSIRANARLLGSAGLTPVPMKLPAEKAKGPHVAYREGCSECGILAAWKTAPFTKPLSAHILEILHPEILLLLKELHPVNPETKKQRVYCSPSNSSIDTSPGRFIKSSLEKIRKPYRKTG